MSDEKPGASQKDPLFSNKVAAAVLTALLLIFGLPQLAKVIFGGGHSAGGDELHLAYCCVDLESEADTDAPEEVYDLGRLMASASAASGERRAALCKSCHTFEEGGAQGTGPNLWDIVNRPVAGVSGYNYSSALKEAGGVWTYERLDPYLANSQEYIPGTAMVQRFPQDDRRADLLAYLGSLSNDPAPFPEPAPIVEEPIAPEAAGPDAELAEPTDPDDDGLIETVEEEVSEEPGDEGTDAGETEGETSPEQ